MATPPADDWETAGHVRTLVVLGATGAGVYLCYRMAVPFLPALTWELTLAVLGAFVVCLPAAFFLAVEGHPGKAVILGASGMLVVGTIDNLLRPIFVGNRLKLHTVLVFISVIGGLIVFGASGLILGPVVFTVTLVMLELWPHRAAVTGMSVKPAALSRWENEGVPEGPEAGETA